MELLAKSDDNANYERVIMIQTESGVTWSEDCDKLLDEGFVHSTKIFSNKLNAYLLLFEKNNVTVDF